MTRQNFIQALENNKPSKFAKFMIKNFSSVDLGFKAQFYFGKWIVYIMMVLFLGGFIGTIIKPNNKVVGVFAIALFVVLFIVVGSCFVAAKMENRRIKRICKELDCTYKEYEYYLKLWKND